jgi:hypothetical protein
LNTGSDRCNIQVINLSTMTEERPSPPFPDPMGPLLALIVRGALESDQSGEIDIEGAILHAAVIGWYEGHVESRSAGTVQRIKTTKFVNSYVNIRVRNVMQPSIEQTRR